MWFMGWNCGKSLLAQGVGEARRRELVNVRIPLDARSAGNLERDMRAALQSDLSLAEDEVPSQACQARRHGGVATCRVAFSMNVPAGGARRVGVLCDNFATAPGRDLFLRSRA